MQFIEKIQWPFVIILHSMFIYVFIVEDMFYSHVYMLPCTCLYEFRFIFVYVGMVVTNVVRTCTPTPLLLGFFWQ